MNIFLIMLVTSCISIIIADILPIVKEIKYRYNRTSLKPFDCNFCLSGWLSLLFSIIWYSGLANLLIVVFVTPFLTSLIFYLWTKIKLLKF